MSDVPYVLRVSGKWGGCCLPQWLWPVGLLEYLPARRVHELCLALNMGWVPGTHALHTHPKVCVQMCALTEAIMRTDRCTPNLGLSIALPGRNWCSVTNIAALMFGNADSMQCSAVLGSSDIQQASTAMLDALQEIKEYQNADPAKLDGMRSMFNETVATVWQIWGPDACRWVVWL